MATRMERAQPAVEVFFEQHRPRVFRLGDISLLLEENREVWGLPRSMSARKFIEFLVESGTLQQVDLQSEHYAAQETRFLSGSPSPYAVGLSLRHNAYLTHASALFLHGLTDQIPKTVFINYEQSQKPRSEGSLSQAALDRAFANRQRESKLWFDYGGYRLMILSGKATGRLEVTTMATEAGELLDVTKLERTLIDITVRPVYAGGVFQVLDAYRQAKDLVSTNTLLATLKKLDYTYPYHQAIGFYMERAGFKPSQWERLLQLGADFDFYLSHALPSNRLYDAKWRLFYPAGI